MGIFFIKKVKKNQMKNIDTIQLSYKDSMQLRGVAILMMLFLHCFNYHAQSDYVDWVINENTLSWWLTKTAGLCVSFYCILSGYGLYKKYPFGYKYCFEKAWILSKRYWFFLALFVGVGVLFFDAYELKISLLLSNFLGYRTTYNPTLWFLLPYLFVLIASPLLLRFFNTHKTWKSIVIVTSTYCIAFYFLKLKAMGLMAIHDIFCVVLESFDLLLSFLCGALFAKYGIPQLTFFENKAVNNVALLAVIMALSVIRCIIDNAVTSPLLCVLLVAVLANIHVGLGVGKLLETFGKHSLNMWFIHAYFTYRYLDFTVYWLKIPLLIFIAVIAYSYVLSWLFDKTLKKLNV